MFDVDNLYTHILQSMDHETNDTKIHVPVVVLSCVWYAMAMRMSCCCWWWCCCHCCQQPQQRHYPISCHTCTHEVASHNLRSDDPHVTTNAKNKESLWYSWCVCVCVLLLLLLCVCTCVCYVCVSCVLFLSSFSNNKQQWSSSTPTAPGQAPTSKNCCCVFWLFISPSNNYFLLLSTTEKTQLSSLVVSTAKERSKGQNHNNNNGNSNNSNTCPCCQWMTRKHGSRRSGAGRGWAKHFQLLTVWPEREKDRKCICD